MSSAENMPNMDTLRQMMLDGGQLLFKTYVSARLDYHNESFVEEIMMELADAVKNDYEILKL